MKVKLKGNESFNIREGWLYKGITAIQKEPTIFTQKNAMDVLGVGSKMVKSIRFWLQATGLTEEIRGTGKREHCLTEDFGRIVFEHDQYFEDITTLWLLHYHIVKNKALCPVWYAFFNEHEFVDFSKKSFVNKTCEVLDKWSGAETYSPKSAEDDCASVIKMYFQGEDSAKDPEENLGSPFAELGLIQHSEGISREYKKAQPIMDKLDKAVVLYIILDSLDSDKRSISVDDLLSKFNSVGKVLNMGRTMLYEYLDMLRNAELLTINRTAGLDMVYIESNISPKDVLINYYQ